MRTLYSGWVDLAPPIQLHVIREGLHRLGAMVTVTTDLHWAHMTRTTISPCQGFSFLVAGFNSSVLPFLHCVLSCLFAFLAWRDINIGNLRIAAIPTFAKENTWWGK